MKKRYVSWMSLLTVCLLGLLCSCTQEALSDFPDSAGTTVLHISTKGIVIDPQQPGANMERYVKTLRLIGYQSGQLVLNNQFSNLKEYIVQGGGADSYIEIPLTKIPGMKIQKGLLDLYAVANEGQSSLDNIAQADLKNLMINAVTNPIILSVENPMLMSAEVHPTLLQEKNEVKINLVRTLGKVELIEVTQEGQTLTGYDYQIKADGMVYDTYPLFGKNRSQGSTAVNIASKGNPLYLSEASALTLTVTVTHDGNNYTGLLSGVPITRNKCIQLRAQLSKKDQCLLLQSALKDWSLVELAPEYK